MKPFLFFFSLLISLSGPIGAATDKNASSFEYQEKKHVDRFDFSGNFPNLENIDIDATKKYRVEMTLDGNFPLLEEIRYLGSFGDLKVKMTGTFHALTNADFSVASSNSKFDLRGTYQKHCTIRIASTRGNMTIIVPKDVGYVLTTHIGPKGRVVTDLKQKGFGWLERRYENDLQEKMITLSLETKEGVLTIKERD